MKLRFKLWMMLAGIAGLCGSFLPFTRHTYIKENRPNGQRVIEYTQSLKSKLLFYNQLQTGMNSDVRGIHGQTIYFDRDLDGKVEDIQVFNYKPRLDSWGWKTRDRFEHEQNWYNRKSAEFLQKYYEEKPHKLEDKKQEIEKILLRFKHGDDLLSYYQEPKK